MLSCTLNCLAENGDNVDFNLDCVNYLAQLNSSSDLAFLRDDHISRFPRIYGFSRVLPTVFVRFKNKIFRQDIFDDHVEVNREREDP